MLVYYLISVDKSSVNEFILIAFYLFVKFNPKQHDKKLKIYQIDYWSNKLTSLWENIELIPCHINLCKIATLALFRDSQI